MRIKGLKARTTARNLKIRFSSSEAASTFSCRLDRGKYRQCSSPYKTKALALGAHTFTVIATDAAGNASEPVKKKFRVLAPST